MVAVLFKDFQPWYNKLIPSHQYRNSRTGARSTRTQIDHDVFEGLPVRHWRKRSFNVSTAPEKDNLDLFGTGDTGWPELPMPRDAHMYSPMSEALLRAARMGQVKKPATPLMDDEKEPGDDEDADGDLDMGFVAKRWAVVPKDMEGPEPEFLAKRRKGLPSVYTGATGPLGNTPQMRKTKIRKVDTEGNSYIWEVLVPEGQAVDGEIVEEESSPTQAPAPGTVVEGLGVVNAEGVVIAGDQVMPATSRRRPPPPKRKAKGPGRGRKKKVAFLSGTEGVSTVNGVGAMLDRSSDRTDDGESTKREHEVPDGDTEMGDENVLQEGEEGSEDGSEGEEGEDGDREEGELSPSPTPAKSPAEPPTIVINDIKGEPAGTRRDATPPPSELPRSSLAEPTRRDNSDPMLLDGDDDEAANHYSSEPTLSSMAQSTEETTDVAAPVGTEGSEETMPTPESIPKTLEAIAEVPYAASITQPQAESQSELMTTPPPDTISQSQPASAEQSVTDSITETLAKQPTQSPVESLSRPGTAPTPDVPAEHGIALPTAELVAVQTLGAFADITKEAMPEPRTDGLEAVLTTSMPASSTGAVEEPTTNTMLTLSTKPISEPNEEPRTEILFEPPTKSIMEFVEESKPLAVQPMDEQPLVEQSTVEQPVVEQPVAEQPVIEQPVAEQPVAEQPVSEQPVSAQPVNEQPVSAQPVNEQPVTEEPTTEQPMTDPWARSATESFSEAISPERRFSYTRVTTSPQAPTPSPPTPIENTFGLKAPYLSPKAPTMSPPTPIERSMSSSPDIPLADQHFRLPPQIDAAQEADQAPVPDMPQDAGADRTSVKAAPNVDARIKAQSTAEHDGLVGMAEPRVAEESEGSTPHFTDGEEDLLGSLERSLGKHSGGS